MQSNLPGRDVLTGSEEQALFATIGRLLILCFISFLVTGMFTATALAQRSWLTADEAFDLRVTRAATDGINLEWTIRDGYYLYRDMLVVQTEGRPESLPLETSAGSVKNDPTFGSSEVYFRQAKAILPSTALQGIGRDASILITYLGCQDGGICYPPITKRVDLTTLMVVDADTPTKAVTQASVPWQSSTNQAASGRASGITLAADSDGGVVSSLLKNGDVPLVLASFALFGIALAFTPCVFPMYPILAGAITRAGDDLSPLRGFVLSGAYVLAMSFAFGLLGIAAAWSGQNLQVALQSPIAIVGVSMLFVVFALSMFGLFELQLPARWVAAIAGRGYGRRGTLRTTALLGFTSALIVGPCVTAPLAGALLYIAQTGDVALGAAALFALGLGKGIPLVIFGTVGAKALPKAGPWMATVKRAFGFVFFATAVWMVSRIIPESYGLVLWALLLITAGVYLGAFDALGVDTPGHRRLAKTAGIVASLYGGMLAVGAASGATDPLRPLSALVQGRLAADQKLTFGRAASMEDISALTSGGKGRPSLIYVTADWCITCDIIERNVLSDPTIRARLERVRLVKADVTENASEQQQMMQALRVVGPPTMIFVDATGREVPGSRLVGDVTTRSLLASLEKAMAGNR